MNLTADRLPVALRRIARGVVAPISFADRLRRWVKTAALVGYVGVAFPEVTR